MHALNRGEIQRVPCVCGSVEAEMHHEDYSKPLEVRWMCRECHLLEHNGPAYPSVLDDRIAELLRRFDARRQLRKAVSEVEWDIEVPGRVA